MQQIVGDLLAAEIAEKQARSSRYQVAAAKLPLAKELADFEFTGSPINESAGARPRQRHVPRLFNDLT